MVVQFTFIRQRATSRLFTVTTSKTWRLINNCIFRRNTANSLFYIYYSGSLSVFNSFLVGNLWTQNSLTYGGVVFSNISSCSSDCPDIEPIYQRDCPSASFTLDSYDHELLREINLIFAGLQIME
jgi:hypothetical protein